MCNIDHIGGVELIDGYEFFRSIGASGKKVLAKNTVQKPATQWRSMKISIFTNPSEIPFKSQTCFKLLHVFINPVNPRAFDWLKENSKNNKSNYSIEGLYNVFLDRSTQIA